MQVAPGATNVICYFKLVNPLTGIPLTGAVIANLDATYVRDQAAAVQANLSTPPGFLVTSAHTDNAAIEVDAVNSPGLYRVDFVDAAFAAGVDRVQLGVNGVAIDPAVMEVELRASDPWLTALPGAYAAGTAGNILGNLAATLTATLTASAAFLAAIAGAVWTWATRTLTSWANLTGSVRTLATQAMSLQFCRGESKVVSIAIQYSGGGAFDITGYDVYWALSQKRGSVALLSKSTVAGSITVISAPQGSITFTISVAESFALAAESYVHEVHIRQQVAPRAEHCALHGAVEVGDSTIGIIP
jgi:hypothetical protein